MSTHRFSKCPTWWVRAGTLKDGFKAGVSTGASIAGLKCVIAISHNVLFQTLKAKLSFSDLETATGLSRPMVMRGVSLINELKLVHIDKGYPNVYTLIEQEENDKGWAKLPISRLQKELPQIPNRGKVTLTALKLYLQLLADRPNDSNVMNMTYDTIQNKVGIQQKHIKPSIDLLFNHVLIGVAKTVVDDGKSSYQKNQYIIHGL